MAEEGNFERGNELRESAKFKEIIKNRIGEREKIHKKTFTKWINSKLVRAQPAVVVRNLVEDLRDGHVLLTLLEVLLNTKLTREKGRLRLHTLTNLTKAMTVLEKNGVKMVGINNTDIADGKVMTILGLVWSIILRFQVQEVMNESEPSTPGGSQDFNVEKKLLIWCEETLDGYEDVVKLKDFTVSWRDGLAFNAIIHAHSPDLFDFDELIGGDNKTNLEHAFNKAYDEFSVPHLLEPSDIDVKSPDKKLIMMYLTSLYDVLQSLTPPKTRKEQRLKLRMQLESYRTAHSEVTLYLTQVETIVSAKLDSLGSQGDPTEEYREAKDLIRDILNHKPDVVDVITKGNELIDGGKISSADESEITNQIALLENRWEKLTLLVSRLNKRCHSAVIMPLQKKIQLLIVWIKRVRSELNQPIESSRKESVNKAMQHHMKTVAEIDRKQPEVDSTLGQVDALCSERGLDEEDRGELEDEAEELTREWQDLKHTALETDRKVQEAVAKITPTQQPITVTVQSQVSSVPDDVDGSPEYSVEVRRFPVPSSPRGQDKKEKEEKLLSWKRKHSDAREVMGYCAVEVKRLKVEQDPKQLKRQLEKCDAELLAADPKVIDATNHGQQLLDDDILDEQTKEELGEEVEMLVSDYDEILRSVDDERNRVQRLLDEDEAKRKRQREEEEAKRKKKMDEEKAKKKELAAWEDAKRKLKPRIARLDVRLKSLKREPPQNSEDLRNYCAEVEDCQKDVTALAPDIKAAMDDGSRLLRGGRLDDRERGHVFNDMDDLDASYNDINDKCAELMKRANEATIRDARRREILESWANKKNHTESQIEKVREKVEEEKAKEPNDYKTAKDKLDRAQLLTTDVDKLEPKVNDTMAFGHGIQSEPAISPSEVKAVDADMREIREKFDKLKDATSRHEEWLIVYIQNEESEKEDKLARWDEAKNRSLSLIDECRKKLDKLKKSRDPTTSEEVVKQMVKAQECSAEVSAVFPEIQSTYDHGNKLMADESLNDDDRDRVQSDMETIGDKLRQLQADIDKERARFEALFKTLEKQEKERAMKDKLAKWDDCTRKLRNLLAKFEAKLSDIKDLGTPQDIKEIEDRVEQTSTLSEDIVAAIPEIQSGYEYGNTLLEDNDLSDQAKDKVEREMNETGDGFKKLKAELDAEHQRLEGLLDEKQSDHDSKLERWALERAKLKGLLEKGRKKTEHIKAEKLPDTREETERQLKNIEDFQEEMMEEFPGVKASVDYGNSLLDESGLTEDEKDVIEREVDGIGNDFRKMKEEVQEHYEKLEDLLDDFESTDEDESDQDEEDGEDGAKPIKMEVVESAPIDEYLIRLEDVTPEERRKAEVNEKRDHWQQLRDNLRSLLDKLRNQLDKSQDEDPKTGRDVRRQIHEAKDCKDELSLAEPAIKEVIDRANELLDDDYVTESEKEAIRVYISTLSVELANLDKKADEETVRLTVLLEQMPKDGEGVEDHVVDERVDREHWERPVLEFREPKENASVTIQLKPKEHHFIIRPNEPIHMYIDKIRDDLTPEERHALEQKRKLDRWSDCRDRLDKLRDRAKEKLDRVRTDGPRDRRHLHEKVHEAKECAEEIEDNEPAVEEVIEFADSLLDDPNIDESNKEPIRYYVTTYQMELRKIHRDARAEEDRLQHLLDESDPIQTEELVEEEAVEEQYYERDDWIDWDQLEEKDVASPKSPRVDQVVRVQFAPTTTDHYVMRLHEGMTLEERAEAERAEKRADWRNWRERLDDLLDRLRRKLERARQAPHSRQDCLHQIEDAKDCQDEIEHAKPHLPQALSHADALIDDDTVPRDEKDEIRRYVTDFEIKLKGIRNKAAEEEDRLQHLLDHYPHPRDAIEPDRLVEEEEIDRQFHEHPEWNVNFEDDELDHANPDEVDHAHSDEVTIRYVSKDRIPDYVSRLHDDLTPEERREAERKEKLGRWHGWTDKLDDLINRLNRRLKRAKSRDPDATPKDIQDQIHEAEECKDMIGDSKPQLEQAKQCAYELLDSDDVTEEEKEEIRTYITTIEIRLKQINKDADREQDSLEELLDEFPKDRDELVQERVEQQYHENPEWDVNFEDHEPRDHDRNEVSIRYVDKSHLPDYISRLHDGMSPEEREEAEKEDNIHRWRSWQDKLDDLIDKLNRKLAHAKSRDPNASRDDICDQIDDARACKEESEDALPQVNHAIACANELLDRDDVSDGDKDEIRTYVTALEIRLKKIHKEAQDEKDSLENLLKKRRRQKGETADLVDEEPIDRDYHTRPAWEVTFDQLHSPDGRRSVNEDELTQENLDRWSAWQDKLDELIQKLLKKLKNIKNQGKPKNRAELEEQKKRIQECKDEVDRVDPVVKDALDCANDLLDDEDVSEDEKDEIRRYIATMEIQLLTVRRETQAEQDRLDGSSDEMDLARKERLGRWAEYRERLLQIHSTSNNDLTDITAMEQPITIEEFDEQIARTEGFLDDVSNSIPEIRQCLEYGNTLLDDDDVSEEEKEGIMEDMNYIGQLFKDTKHDADQHYQWLKNLRDQHVTGGDHVTGETTVEMVPVEVVEAEIEEGLPFELTPEEERERERKAKKKREKMDEWKERQKKIDEKLDRLREKLKRVKSRDRIRDKKTLKEKKHGAKECIDNLETAEPEIKQALSSGYSLLDDDSFTVDEKEPIREYINSLETQIADIQNEAAEEEESLDIEIQQLEAEKVEKVFKWKKWKDKVEEVLNEQRGKLDNVKKKGEPTKRQDIDERILITKDCEDSLDAADPEIRFALDYGRQLADDIVLEPDEQAELRNEVQGLERDVADVRNDAVGMRQKLYEDIQSLEAQKTEKLKAWAERKRTTRLLLERMRSKLGSVRMKLKPRNKSEIKERLEQVKDCEEELGTVEKEVTSCVQYGRGLVSEGTLDAHACDKVKDDIDDIEENLQTLKKQTADEQQSLANLLEEEEAIKLEKQQKYRDWRKEIEELLQALRAKLKRLPRNEKDAPQSEKNREECMKLAQECSRDLEKCEEEVKAVKDYGKGLLDDDATDAERAMMERDWAQADEDLSAVRHENEAKQDMLSAMFQPISDDEADNPAMAEWRDRVSRIRMGYKIAEEKLSYEEPLTKLEISDKLEEIRELNTVFAETEPEFLETIDYGKEVLSSESLPDKNRLEMKDDILSMAERWHYLNNKARDDEQRLESLLAATEEQSRELVSWHEQCDGLQAWTDDVIALLETRPVSPGQSFGNMKRQQSVTEDVVSQLMDKQIEVNDVIDEGNKFLDDTSIGDDERGDIHQKMMKLHNDWDVLSHTIASRQEDIQEKMVELEKQHQDMMANWRKRYGPLMVWIAQAETRLSKDFAIAPDLDSVKKQLPQIKSFAKEKQGRAQEVKETQEIGEHLVKDSHINEDDKNEIQKEMDELQHRWTELDESLHWKEDRIEDTVRKLEIQQEDKLRKWDEGLDEVNTWVQQTKAKIRPEPLLARDVDAAYDQFDSFQDLVRDAPIYQDKVTNLNEFSSNLVTDPCLGEQQRESVRGDIAECNEDWNDLVNLANARQSKFESNLNELESQQNDQFNTWTSRSSRASELLDKFESEMSTLDEPLALTLEEVEKQDQDFDVFANQVDVNESQLKDTFKLGEDIRRDSKYSKAKRDSVHGQLNLLLSRWDRIKDFVDLRKGRLEETAKRLRQDRENKRDEWDDKLLEVDVLLNNAEKDFRAADSLADDLPTLKRQNAEFKKVADDVTSKKRKVTDFDRFTNKLSADPVMDDVSRDHMKIERDARLERWDAIQDKIEKHQEKLNGKLAELEKGQDELTDWRHDLSAIQDHVGTLERKCGQPVSRDLASLEQQKKFIDNTAKDAEVFDSRVKEFLRSSEDLMGKTTISSTDRRTIDKECDQLETRWHRLKTDLGKEERKIDERREALLLRLKTLLGQWEHRKTAVSTWLSEMEAGVKTQGAPAADLDKARGQKHEMVEICREIAQYAKQIRDLEEFAEATTREPCMREFEQKLVTNEKESLRARYEDLDQNAEAVNKALSERVDKLEKEQRAKMDQWETKTAPLNEWLADAEVRVESCDPIGYDVPMVERQRQETKEMMNDFLKQKPKFASARDLGNKLVTEPCLGREERDALELKMTSQQEQWDELYESVTQRNNEIQERLKQLEEEEEARKRAELEDKMRRENEKKRKEEERAEAELKKKEEEERQRRAEEKRKNDEKEKKKKVDNKYFSSQLTYEPRVAKPVEESHVMSSPYGEPIIISDEPLVEGALVDDQFSDPFADAENESRNKLATWRDNADEVRLWLKGQEFKIKPESEEEDIVGLKEQKKDLMMLEKELAEMEPKYRAVKEDHNALRDNQFLGEADQEAADEDMHDIEAQWEKMCVEKDQKKKRIEGKIADEERKKLDKLIGCRADLRNLQEWISRKNDEFERLEPIAKDLKGATRQKSELKDFSKEVLDHEPKFTRCTQSAVKLSKDPGLSEDECHVIQKEADDCEERWDTLNEKVSGRVDDVVHKVLLLQKKEKELMDEWKDKLERFERSVKKSDSTLDSHAQKGPEGLPEVKSSPDVTSELQDKANRNEDISWRNTVDESKDRLSKLRIKLQRIQRDKRNRKWSILDAIKEVFGFGKREPKPSIQLDRLIERLEDHEDLMQETSSVQRPANDLRSYGETIRNSNELDEANEARVDDQLSAANQKWNALNMAVIYRENRLEQLAREIEDEYQRFDKWRESCENMAQFTKECDRLTKQEDKVGSDVKTLQKQLKDCQEFKKEVAEYEPQAENVFTLSQQLLDSGRLDKADADGVEQTRVTLKGKWTSINKHISDREEKVNARLIELLKKDTEGRLWQWRHKSIELETSLTDANRKLQADVDETDFVAIQESAVEVEALESAIDTNFSTQINAITDDGLDIVNQKALHPEEEGEVSDSLNTLNKQIGDLGQRSKEKKQKIKAASGKFFSRALDDAADSANRIEGTAQKEFAEVGTDIVGVQKQMVELQKFEDDMLKEEDSFDDLQKKMDESKAKHLLPEEEERRLAERADKIQEQWERIRREHGDYKKRLTQAMIVLHEELMEEVNDWLDENEKLADSIHVKDDDIESAKEEYTQYTELKEEIRAFDPTFKRAISLSEELLRDHLVDPDRAESYEKEIESLEERMNVLELKTMDNGTKFSVAFARRLTTRLDDAEVSLTAVESRLGQDDPGYVDLDSSKKQLESSKAFMNEVSDTNRTVTEIVSEAEVLVNGEYFKKHEEEHFRGRTDKIRKRNDAITQQAEQEKKRVFDTYILLLRQHLNKMDDWLTKAEKRIAATEEIGPGYDAVQKQQDEHQRFQDEIREHSMITVILELDITDPTINESVQGQVKSLSERWASVWRWSEERRARLVRMLNEWQKYRDEQLVLLNWLSGKEKVLKDMGGTDLSDEEEVAKHLDQLKNNEKELDEQGIRLQTLHKTGEDLLRDGDPEDPSTKDIQQQLADFDECWNDLAKQVIERIHTLESSQSKLKEFHEEMAAVSDWMDDVEKIIAQFSPGMDAEAATDLQAKVETKCEERPKFAVRVDRINRLGKDLGGDVDQPSHDAITEELEPFNQRWAKVSEQLENMSDTGYPQRGNECCMVRILRNKLGICH
ncbi:dystrophin isoform X2 [Nematostella vectensis]|uniref:dystrophin isoform X2 n=1 Tax=Nematostella vectensis TaxID=45351 RepID=UPI0020771EED|nr:dystrophin isoform X2 [Nematostella vectensis]